MNLEFHDVCQNLSKNNLMFWKSWNAPPNQRRTVTGFKTKSDRKSFNFSS